MDRISASVGAGGVNRPDDVRVVQSLLRGQPGLGPLARPPVTGTCDRATIDAIAEFQRREVPACLLHPGLIEPGSESFRILAGKQWSAGRGASPDLQKTLDALEAEAVTFATRFIKDGRARAAYVAEAARFSDELRQAYRAGTLSAGDAAAAATRMRNELMQATRLRVSDLGRAASEQLKREGKTLDALIETYARKLFDKSASSLSKAEREAVFLAVVDGAGRPNVPVTVRAARFGKVGRGLLVLSLAISVYTVATADDKWDAAGREAAATAGGFAGGAAGGALAGLACGPGAPVCVTVGVFVGGALGALGVDFGWDWLKR